LLPLSAGPKGVFAFQSLFSIHSGVIFLQVKLLGYEANNTPSSNAEIKNK
jgi:hypothetical protein